MKGFSIVGKDGKAFAAEAKIDGDTVVVWSEKVVAPTAVRCGWSNNPECTLHNKEGLPAGPFRSDNPDVAEYRKGLK